MTYSVSFQESDIFVNSVNGEFNFMGSTFTYNEFSPIDGLWNPAPASIVGTLKSLGFNGWMARGAGNGDYAIYAINLLPDYDDGATMALLEIQESLNETMGLGDWVYSDGNGRVWQDWKNCPYTEGLISYHEDEEIDIDDMSPSDLSQWVECTELLSGFTGQYSYDGALLHESEFIGGGLESHIRNNAGWYVALPVEEEFYICPDCGERVEDSAGCHDTDSYLNGVEIPDYDRNPVGWVVAYHATHPAPKN